LATAEGKVVEGVPEPVPPRPAAAPWSSAAQLRWIGARRADDPARTPRPASRWPDQGIEYIAKYNLGYDVPYTPYRNSDVTQAVISEASRGAGRPVWELFYNHYVVLKKMDAPYTRMFAEKMRPEGGGGDYGPNSGGYDQLGFGTLTYSLASRERRHRTLGCANRRDLNSAQPGYAVSPEQGMHRQTRGCKLTSHARKDPQ